MTTVYQNIPLLFHSWLGDNTLFNKDKEYIGYERTPASLAKSRDCRRRGTTAWQEFCRERGIL